jgi:hypothetical protein
MDILKQVFLGRHTGWCVSLFMPTHRAGRDVEQDPIRFKNLLREAEESLTAKGLRVSEVQELFKGPRGLLQDRTFWQRQSDGLAVFFCAEAFHFFRLPMVFKELVVVSHRFHVKPLLPILTSDGTFYILALSQNQLRFLEGTRHSVDETDLENVPQNLADALPPDASGEKELQFHTGASSGSGNRPAIFHGHDIMNDNKNRIMQWFRMIDKHLRGFLDGKSPLVLAGVDTLFPLYKEVNTYPHLMNEGISGNPEGMTPEDLHQKAWTIVEPVFKAQRNAHYARFGELAGTGQTTTDVTQAVLAAHHGRIDVLFVPVGVQVWGGFTSETEGVYVHDALEQGDEDLLDLTAIQTLTKGGTVYVVSPENVPDQALLAASLRY